MLTSRKMTDYNRYIQEIMRGKVTKNIKCLRKVSPAKWMRNLEPADVMRMADTLSNYLMVTGGITSKKQAGLFFDVALFLLENIAASEEVNYARIFSRALGPICSFLIKTGMSMETPQQRNYNSVVMILRRIRKCVEKKCITFRMLSSKLFEILIDKSLAGNADLQRESILLVSAFAGDEEACSYIQTEFQNFGLRKKQGKRGKKPKTPRQTAGMVLVSFVQHHLTVTNKPSAYARSFVFVASLIHALCNQCAVSKLAADFVNSLIDELLALTYDVMTPAAAWILNFIMKQMSKFSEPGSPVKLQVLAVKQMPKVALKLNEKAMAFADQREKLKARFGPNWEQVPLLAIMFFFHHHEVEQKFGNVLQTYLTLQAEHQLEVEIVFNGMVTEEEAQAAAFLLETSNPKHSSFENYVKHVVRAAASNVKAVKSAAVKSLGQLVLEAPRVLAMPSVGAAMADCVRDASATGRLRIAQVLAHHVAQHPADSALYQGHFHELLADPAPSVRCATINAVREIFLTQAESPLLIKLALKVLTLIQDSEGTVQRAVQIFFTSVWLDSNLHTSCLVEISRYPIIGRCLTALLTQRQTSTRAVCLSQVPSAVANLVDKQVALLAAAVTECLQKEEQVAARRWGAASLLRAIARVHPEALRDLIGALSNILFSCGPTEILLQRTLANTLAAVAHYSDANEGGRLSERVSMLLQEDRDLPTANLTALLNLLVVVSDGLRQEYVTASIALLKREKDIAVPKNVIKRALCFVIYLWKDYTNDDETAGLILRYFKSPKYNLTVLSALCQARLEFVPSRHEPFLVKLICHYLSDKSDAPLVKNALFFLNCTLQGYQRSIELPQMKEMGDSTTEAVSLLLQSTLPRVLECSLDADHTVRREACQVLRLIVQTGLILPTTLLPHLVALATDLDSDVQRNAQTLLASVAHSWDISLAALAGFQLAFKLAKATHPTMKTIRGFNAAWTSTCHATFEILQPSSAKVRKLVDCLITGAQEVDDWNLKLFLIDQLIYFRYKTAGELKYVKQALVSAICKLPSGGRDPCKYLFQKGEHFLTQAYKIVGKKMEGTCLLQWSQELVHRSKNCDYIVSLALNAPSEGADAESDDEDDYPLANLLKELPKPVTDKVEHQETTAIHGAAQQSNEPRAGLGRSGHAIIQLVDSDADDEAPLMQRVPLANLLKDLPNPVTDNEELQETPIRGAAQQSDEPRAELGSPGHAITQLKDSDADDEAPFEQRPETNLLKMHQLMQEPRVLLYSLEHNINPDAKKPPLVAPSQQAPEPTTAGPSGDSKTPAEKRHAISKRKRHIPPKKRQARLKVTKAKCQAKKLPEAVGNGKPATPSQGPILQPREVVPSSSEFVLPRPRLCPSPEVPIVTEVKKERVRIPYFDGERDFVQEQIRCDDDLGPRFNPRVKSDPDRETTEPPSAPVAFSRSLLPVKLERPDFPSGNTSNPIAVPKTTASSLARVKLERLDWVQPEFTAGSCHVSGQLIRERPETPDSDPGAFTGALLPVKPERPDLSYSDILTPIPVPNRVVDEREDLSCPWPVLPPAPASSAARVKLERPDWRRVKSEPIEPYSDFVTQANGSSTPKQSTAGNFQAGIKRERSRSPRFEEKYSPAGVNKTRFFRSRSGNRTVQSAQPVYAQINGSQKVRDRSPLSDLNESADDDIYCFIDETPADVKKVKKEKSRRNRTVSTKWERNQLFGIDMSGIERSGRYKKLNVRRSKENQNDCPVPQKKFYF